MTSVSAISLWLVCYIIALSNNAVTEYRLTQFLHDHIINCSLCMNTFILFLVEFHYHGGRRSFNFLGMSYIKCKIVFLCANCIK